MLVLILYYIVLNKQSKLSKVLLLIYCIHYIDKIVNYPKCLHSCYLNIIIMFFILLIFKLFNK